MKIERDSRSRKICSMATSDRMKGLRRKRYDKDWREALQYAIDSILPEDPKNVPGVARPDARVVAFNASGNNIEIELRFYKHCNYCCCEPGCHISTEPGFWKRFRSALAEVSSRVPPLMTIVIQGVVEQGARFSYGERGEMRPSKRIVYLHVMDEEKTMRRDHPSGF